MSREPDFSDLPVEVKPESMGPLRPGTTTYCIKGPNPDVVQAAITRICDIVDVAFGGVPGRASFHGPCRVNGAWYAHGQVVRFGVTQEVAHAD